MKTLILPLLLTLVLVGISPAQTHPRSAVQPGFYLKLDWCIACGAYGDQIAQLLKQNGVSAFNGYAECPGYCFSPGQFAEASKIIRTRPQESTGFSVVAGPFPTADAAIGVMRRLRSMLKPVFNDWNQRWPNSSLTHDKGNVYNIEPLSISLIKFGAVGGALSPRGTANTNSLQDDGFRSFYVGFKRAALANDRAALRSMMMPNFMWALDEWTPRDQVLRQMDEWKYWTKFRTAIATSRPVRCQQPYCGFGDPVQFYAGYRVGHRQLGDLLFVRDSSGNWKWAGLLGD